MLVPPITLELKSKEAHPSAIHLILAGTDRTPHPKNNNKNLINLLVSRTSKSPPQAATQTHFPHPPTNTSNSLTRPFPARVHSRRSVYRSLHQQLRVIVTVVSRQLPRVDGCTGYKRRAGKSKALGMQIVEQATCGLIIAQLTPSFSLPCYAGSIRTTSRGLQHLEPTAQP